MIQRTTLNYINSLIKQNSSWNVLDIGCGYSAHPLANTISDVIDLSGFYEGKNFIKLSGEKLPFKDKEFDFVISSHVLEHVENVEFFISELERVSSQGYIEVPTKLEDNIVFENKKEHLHLMEFDDVEKKLIIKNKVQFIEPFITVSSIKKLEKIFRDSLLIELFWQGKIEYVIQDKIKEPLEKISLINLIRKYFSKKLRMILK